MKNKNELHSGAYTFTASSWLPNSGQDLAKDFLTPGVQPSPLYPGLLAYGRQME